MKRASLLLMMGCMMASVANAALVATYSASASPGDALDANDNAVDVWTVTGFDGANRSYYQGSVDGNDGLWGIWDRSDGVDGGFSGTYATHTFAGGALTVGQSVSLDYSNQNIDDGEMVGIRLLDGASSEAEFVFIGGTQAYSYTDSASADYTATSKGWSRVDLFQVVFTLTDANSYSMSITSGSGGEDGNPDVGSVVDSWSGTFTGSSIDGIQVFTEGGDGSDQRFDNLAVVPEPATIGLVGAFGVVAFLMRRRFSK